MTTWAAPRTAYEYTAAVAAGDRAAAGAVWDTLDTRGRADLVLALGAQARLAVTARVPREHAGQARAAQFAGLTELLIAGPCCEGVLRFALAALGGRVIIARRPRGCPDQDTHLRTAATALAETALRAGEFAGLSRKHMAIISARCAGAA